MMTTTSLSESCCRTYASSIKGARNDEMRAALMRQLKGRPPVFDLLRLNGREWLRQLELPVEGCGTVEAAMRHIEFLDQEIAEVERLIAPSAAPACPWRLRRER